MALLGELKEPEFSEWVASRPKVIQEMIEKWPPNRLYLMKPHRQRVTLVSYSEDGTVMVNLSAQYNLISFERQVFGIDPNNLEECDLPADDEPLGAIFTEEKDIQTCINIIGETIKNER